MKKIFALLGVIIALTFTVILEDAANAAEPLYMKRINLATQLVNEMSQQSDAAAMASAIKDAKGIALFPHVTKAGFIFGAEDGQGLVLLRTPNGGWTGPSFVGISGASFGFQAGIESIGLLLVINNQKGLTAFTGGNSFKLGADVAIAAGPIGRSVGVGTNAPMKASIYSYSMTKGVFAGVSVGGSIINQNRDLNRAYWGTAISAQKALSKPAKNAKILPLIQALNSLLTQAK
ncbi:MAG: lipid-binding SYLF domain-containing protein [Cloacibacillus sp.]